MAVGIGADYAAFLSRPDGRSSAGLAGIALAGLTTMLAFGLLGLSTTPALTDFGLTMVMGILSAWLCAALTAPSATAEEACP
jgi:predicted exporter